ncbi:anti-sigma factor [Histidinibacterium aquaticum]|uniref:Regulator of SigK n=1 Tax=Histidinibacterium aquaticum TaxID=2613962 RepID=A0A5J5GI83_9RHOB|nr:anti-sigma factor [Histidinibacterium aquaticum]KAA9007911.1 hypothetical protein F3S47_10325 [Histidinibacterium aquaticum]
MSDQPGQGDDGDAGLAAEYVLGLLGPEERAACDARLESDPAFRAEVADWAERMGSLAMTEVASVDPPPQLYGRIERELFPDQARRWWQKLGIAPAILGAAAAAGLAWFAVNMDWLTGTEGPFTPAYQAELAAEDGGLLIRAAFDPETGTLALNREEGAPAAGRDFELWLIEGENAPVSLGVLPPTRLARFELPEGATLDNSVLAVSDEPEGGSPTGAPTGDVLAASPVSAL